MQKKAPFLYKNIVQKYIVVISFIMLGTALIFTGRDEVMRLLRVANLPSYEYLNPSVTLLDKKNLLVNFEPLRQYLNKEYQNRNDYLVSIYFEYLPTGANINVNRDERIWPASLIKIPVAMSAMKKVEDKEWKLTNELVILDDDKDTEFGELYKQPPGTTLTVQKTLEESLINSDNTAHSMLLRNIDASEIEETYRHLGMDDIIDALKKSPKGQETDNRMTAKRYTIFFRSLYNATYLSPEYSELFLDILQHAPQEHLSRGLPSRVKFVHKTGVRVDEQVWADSGIVYVPGRPYLLTVMIQRKDTKKQITDEVTKEVEGMFQDIAREIYVYVSSAQ